MGTECEDIQQTVMHSQLNLCDVEKKWLRDLLTLLKGPLRGPCAPLWEAPQQPMSRTAQPPPWNPSPRWSLSKRETDKTKLSQTRCERAVCPHFGKASVRFVRSSLTQTRGCCERPAGRRTAVISAPTGVTSTSLLGLFLETLHGESAQDLVSVRLRFIVGLSVRAESADTVTIIFSSFLNL